ncbi:hypothetical protein [Companilactobacillus sp.]|uniref:hypothetical protein n=1 Tax=Companilactobacillus sp. TaxID=2767905 RepID=UPI00260422D3|nr:hypothetical protein [Companilactobacillus sp.]
MDNYEYSPQELKIIVGIANKHKIPVSIGNEFGKYSIIIHSKRDFTPLLIFSIRGFNLLVGFDFNSIDYYEEIVKYSKIFMQGRATLKS